MSQGGTAPSASGSRCLATPVPGAALTHLVCRVPFSAPGRCVLRPPGTAGPGGAGSRPERPPPAARRSLHRLPRRGHRKSTAGKQSGGGRSGDAGTPHCDEPVQDDGCSRSCLNHVNWARTRLRGKTASGMRACGGRLRGGGAADRPGVPEPRGGARRPL